LRCYSLKRRTAGPTTTIRTESDKSIADAAVPPASARQGPVIASSNAPADHPSTQQRHAVQDGRWFGHWFGRRLRCPVADRESREARSASSHGRFEMRDLFNIGDLFKIGDLLKISDLFKIGDRFERRGISRT